MEGETCYLFSEHPEMLREIWERTPLSYLKKKRTQKQVFLSRARITRIVTDKAIAVPAGKRIPVRPRRGRGRPGFPRGGVILLHPGGERCVLLGHGKKNKEQSKKGKKKGNSDHFLVTHRVSDSRRGGGGSFKVRRKHDAKGEKGRGMTEEDLLYSRTRLNEERGKSRVTFTWGEPD